VKIALEGHTAEKTVRLEEPLHKRGGKKKTRLNLVRGGCLTFLLEDRVLKINTLKPSQQRTAEITHHAGIVADDRASEEFL